MFCPKCGVETTEGQRFCKACGVNIQLVSEALSRGEDSLGQLRIDIDSVKRTITEVGKGIKEGFSGIGSQPAKYKDTNPIPEHIQISQKPKAGPKPKEWLSYSRQHNLKYGLLSLFSGAGFGVFLYYALRVAINAGTIKSLEDLSHTHGLEAFVRIMWLFAAIPIAKGIAQIIYGAFFGVSLTKVADMIAPPQPIQIIQQAPAELPAPPPSVTEHTTFTLREPASGESQSEIPPPLKVAE